MPYKHTESRRHKLTKPKYKVTNWPEYNDPLRQRGDMMIWITEEAVEQWHPVKLCARGRPQVYSDHAIETAILFAKYSTWRYTNRRLHEFADASHEGHNRRGRLHLAIEVRCSSRKSFRDLFS
ncbi:transposase [Rhodoferax sp.]|uniref:transposase n=1 Tax=Rhodoferax sp. TaxID=50421 RepID=UPI00283F1854|nr:transposase [Rhodoferax sp.]MDR3371710.1 transposase [Rhodoferax sp.]